VTEETRDLLPGATAELICDPMYLHARVQEILADAEEYASPHPHLERFRHESAALMAGLKALAKDLLVHGPTGDELFATVTTAAPELDWHRGSTGAIHAFAATDEQAERAVAVLDLAPRPKPVIGRRLWTAEIKGIEVKVYGPCTEVQESDR
jgi:hypothetical protein